MKEETKPIITDEEASKIAAKEAALAEEEAANEAKQFAQNEARAEAKAYAKAKATTHLFVSRSTCMKGFVAGGVHVNMRFEGARGEHGTLIINTLSAQRAGYDLLKVVSELRRLSEYGVEFVQVSGPGYKLTPEADAFLSNLHLNADGTPVQATRRVVVSHGSRSTGGTAQ